MADRLPFSGEQYWNAVSRNAFPGAKLYAYTSLSRTVLKTIYTDEAAGTPLTNPVIADANGLFPAIYGNGEYFVDIYNSDDTTLIYQEDEVFGSTPANANATTTVSLIADLRLVDTTAFQSAFVEGTTAIDDGGQGRFYFDSLSVAIDNGTTIIAPTVGTGRWLILNVETLAIGDDAVTTAKILDSNVTTAKVNDLAITNGKIAATTITGAKIVNNTLTSTQIGTGAIHRDEIATTSNEVTDDPGGTVNTTYAIGLGGGVAEQFGLRHKMIDNGGTTSVIDITGYNGNSTSYERRIVGNLTSVAGNIPGITVSVDNVDASPPWDIGDGEIPFFTYVRINSSGRAVSISSSTNPPWDVYNQAENIIKAKLSDSEIYEKYGVNKDEIGNGRKYKLKRSIVSKSSGEFKDELVEIDANFKNTHMSSLAHPFKGWSNNGASNDSDFTIALIDPCETLALLEMAKGGFSINDMIIGKDPDLPQLLISNDFIKGRCTPHPDIKIIPVKWR